VRKLFSLFAAPTGFGTAGIRRQRICGALTLIGSGISALQRGVELAETGIGVTSFEVRYFPRVNEYHENNLGERDGNVRSSVASRELTVEGEVTGATGLMAHTFLAAATFANDVADFGSPTGGFYAQEFTVTQGRANWRTFRGRYESDPGLT
jgi:hypothetical protein